MTTPLGDVPGVTGVVPVGVVSARVAHEGQTPSGPVSRLHCGQVVTDGRA